MDGSSSVTIVMYHYVRPQRKDVRSRVRALDAEQFRRQLEWLSERYAIISIEALKDFVDNGTPLPRNPCLLTFDDGYKDHFNYVFPELQKHKLKGCFFPSSRPVQDRRALDVNKIQFIMAMQPDATELVARLKGLMEACRRELQAAVGSYDDFRGYWSRYGVPGRFDSRETLFFKRMLQHALPEPVRRHIIDELFRQFVTGDEEAFVSDLYMSGDDMKEMISYGMSFGGHGYRHVWLNHESEAVQTDEIDRSLSMLSALGVATDGWVMCYPFGGYDERTLNILRSRNCQFAMTVEPNPASIRPDALLELGRFDTRDFTCDSQAYR